MPPRRSRCSSAIENFSNFMRFLDAPKPSPDTPGGATSIANGKQKFIDVGCALCHTPSFTTSKSTVAALSMKPVNLFSDLLVHDMGDGLADGVSQGEAGPREFRTAPLWGLGQRIFFLHDGRTVEPGARHSRAFEHRLRGERRHHATSTTSASGPSRTSSTSCARCNSSPPSTRVGIPRRGFFLALLLPAVELERVVRVGVHVHARCPPTARRRSPCAGGCRRPRPARPWRPTGMLGRTVQLFAAGSYASSARKAYMLTVSWPSPPVT